ncbi:MAG TPA: serine hydrolase [Candidatus Acidoferrales bacterium]|nr:serine hydrolase [Candidatus Acidoferrales bacterium]
MLSRFTLLTLLVGLCQGQDTARKEITLDSQTLSRYVGAYKMASGANMLITLENNQLLSKLGNQQAIPIFPESKTMFFPKVVDAELEFTKDDDRGRPTELILHQNGRDMPAKRLDDAQAKLLADAAAAFAKRFKDQTAAPGGETALRQMVEDLGLGKPNYDLMSPGLAEATRQQLPQLQSMISKLGAMQSMVFKGVGPGGADIYSVRFEKGALEYRIWLGVDGKVESANVHPDDVAATAASLRPQLPEIDSLIAADLARRPVGSVTAGVVSGKQLIWSKSYGDADMEKKTAADNDTVYRIGSITKMFTALMLEQLVEAKKVHLSDPVEKYFPEIKTVQGRFPDAPPITLVQLATHTAGLGREPDNTDTYVKGPVADWEKTLIAALPHTHYILEPGTRFAYSNIGFAILGAALSRAAGEPYVEYIPKHIFQPLGMTHSALERNAQVMPHLSKGYQPMGPSGEVDSETPQREHETGRGYKVPNGAIYTTVGDLARFASFLLGQGPESVLKTASLEGFQTQSAVPADFGLANGYGIGFEVHRRENYVAFGHGGAVAGYTASLLMNRKAGVGVIVLSSGAVNPASLAERALDMLSK